MTNNDKNISKSRPRPSQAEGDARDPQNRQHERENLEGGELDRNEKPPRPSQAEGEAKSRQKKTTR